MFTSAKLSVNGNQRGSGVKMGLRKTAVTAVTKFDQYSIPNVQKKNKNIYKLHTVLLGGSWNSLLGYGKHVQQK